MNASIPTFPDFRDESGVTAPVRRSAPRHAEAPAPASSFRDELAAVAPSSPDQPAAASPEPRRHAVTITEFRDENGGPTFAAAPAPAASEQPKEGVTLFAEGDTPTFWDFLDLINPLQHIPVVNTLYREITGDEIGALPRMVGGALLGGPIGAAVTVANLVVEDATGQDVGEHVLAMLRGGEAAPGAPAAPVTAVASAETPARADAEQQAAAPPPEDTLPVFDSAPVRVAAADPGAGRFMPLPPRGSLAVPATPVAARAAQDAAAATPLPMPSPEAIRRAAAAQGVSGDDHPLLRTAQAAPAEATRPAPVSAAKAASAPSAPAPDAQSQGFVNRFMEAMDKYDRARGLGAVREN